jgi:hypothetical protein
MFTSEYFPLQPPQRIDYTGSQIYDTVQVYPNPATLQNKIPNGIIQAYTIRRKVDNDQSVIVFQSSPDNDQGYQTLSGPGYLIPNDFTDTQKRNALSIINNLKAKSAFIDENNIIFPTQ